MRIFRIFKGRGRCIEDGKIISHFLIEYYLPFGDGLVLQFVYIKILKTHLATVKSYVCLILQFNEV